VGIEWRYPQKYPQNSRLPSGGCGQRRNEMYAEVPDLQGCKRAIERLHVSPLDNQALPCC
jgi:hypothetical protein